MKDESGRAIENEDDISQFWKDYFEELVSSGIQD